MVGNRMADRSSAEDARAGFDNRSIRGAADTNRLADAVRLANQRAEAAEAAALANASRVAAIEGSTVWRASRPLRSILGRFPTARRTVRHALRTAWRAVTFQHRRARRELQAQIRAVAASPFFDRNWYLGRYPDVAAAGVDPAAHYATHGAADRRSPGPAFDGDWYLSTYPDVAARGANPLLHYMKYGIAEGRDRRPVLKAEAHQVDLYVRWVREHDTLDDDDRAAIRAHIGALERQPLISIVVPVHNTHETDLREMIESVLQQIYPRFELCLADDASTKPHVREVLELYRRQDPRIKVVYRQENGHISASQQRGARARGRANSWRSWIMTTCSRSMPLHDGSAINEHPEADIFYSDEDKLDEAGRRRDPYFKSDWNAELFYAQNFVNHLGVYRTSLVRAIGGFRLGFEGSQDYDLTLRASAETRGPIVHIPHVLYHWRLFPGANTYSSSQLEQATSAARRAISERLASLG